MDGNLTFGSSKSRQRPFKSLRDPSRLGIVRPGNTCAYNLPDELHV